MAFMNASHFVIGQFVIATAILNPLIKSKKQSERFDNI